MSARNLSEKYQAVHMRVREVRGKASEQECAECGTQARDWAYDGLDPNAVCGKSWNGAGLNVYSLDPRHYQALCRSCHQIKDQAERRLWTLARKAGEVAA